MKCTNKICKGYYDKWWKKLLHLSSFHLIEFKKSKSKNKNEKK